MLDDRSIEAMHAAVGSFLRNARVSAGISVADAAKRTGVDVEDIQSCESGDATIGLWDYMALCDLYGVDGLVGIDAMSNAADAAGRSQD